MLSGSFYFWHLRCSVAVMRESVTELSCKRYEEGAFFDSHRIENTTQIWKPGIRPLLLIILLVTAKCIY